MSTLVVVPKQRFEKTWFLESAGNAEDDPVHKTKVALTITAVDTILRGTTPSVTWAVRHATDRNAAGTLIASGTSTSTTTGHTAAVSVSVPADSFIWLETSAQSGTVLSFAATVVGVEA